MDRDADGTAQMFELHLERILEDYESWLNNKLEINVAKTGPIPVYTFYPRSTVLLSFARV